MNYKMTKGKLREEAREQLRFIKFLSRTKRLNAIDQYERTKDCIHVLEDFSILATNDHPETIDHLHMINREHKSYREHALDCKRCQHSLDAMFVFLGHETPEYLFPKKIQKILDLEYGYNKKKRKFEYDENKKIFLSKLPAPMHSNFGSAKARLVYTTNSPIEAGVEEFYQRIKEPLKLRGLTQFGTPYTKKSPNDQEYWQTDCHHKNPNYHTKISIRSRKK